MRIPFPLKIPAGDLHIHKIIVAHGAKEACLSFSDANVSGSLAVCYAATLDRDFPWPFLVSLDKEDPVHLFDSHSLEIILAELDTLHDLNAYLNAKEKAIEKLDLLAYCGEEDLLAHYFINYDPKTRSHLIGFSDEDYNGFFIEEGEWAGLYSHAALSSAKRRKQDFVSLGRADTAYAENALNGTLTGNGNIFEGQSAVHEMAKEPRVWRRALSDLVKTAILNFPEGRTGVVRQVTLLPSFDGTKAYVFLQLWHPNIVDYEADYRPKRLRLLEIACGVARNKFPKLTKIIGIAVDAPKLSRLNSEDFILMNCTGWSTEQRQHYEDANRPFRFFETDALKMGRTHIQEFPANGGLVRSSKIGRNERCFCGSGKKFRHCHGSAER